MKKGKKLRPTRTPRGKIRRAVRAARRARIERAQDKEEVAPKRPGSVAQMAEREVAMSTLQVEAAMGVVGATRYRNFAPVQFDWEPDVAEAEAEATAGTT